MQRFTRPLHDLLTCDANEGDTRLLITDMLCEGLGYDKFRDLTTEYMVKQDFADYGVRIDKQLIAFIEVAEYRDHHNGPDAGDSDPDRDR
ncbi:hypothetical protein NIBR502772_21765 [Pseudarthrobacter sp. NIBRBAC000502772]|uniref:hypothetical protein n=1 Tax=Pseudarthrobacter sp. NIBRBAC000502772 TaxID=2590775 RepID=UPI00113238BD|nr:hypothetical protein [Pseudarthrobacter sp. NIBRBAC000502772]QDG68483.1 hypothetical protein NIBR502772_21765 [Pseudarthrobacter sp. NIBRBAC000502772]